MIFENATHLMHTESHLNGTKFYQFYFEFFWRAGISLVINLLLGTIGCISMRSLESYLSFRILKSQKTSDGKVTFNLACNALEAVIHCCSRK
jgi:hypothetical protein